MRYNSQFNREGDYAHFVADSECGLLEFLLATVKESRSKIKATLQGWSIKSN